MTKRNTLIFVFLSYATIIKNVISVEYSSTVKSNRSTIPNDIPSHVTSVTISSKSFIIAKGISIWEDLNCKLNIFFQMQA